MGRAVRAEQVGVGQGTGIAPVRLDPSHPGAIYGREVPVSDDDLMPETL